MRTFLDFIKTVTVVTDILGNKRIDKSQNIAPDHNRSIQMDKTMSNDELIKALRILKNDGIAYRYIAKKCNIKESTFYDYLRREKIPYQDRQVITKYINDHFREILDNEL